MSTTHVSVFRVREYECDAYGHLNNVNYVRYLGEAALDALSAEHFDLTYQAAKHYRWQTRKLDIEHLKAARYGDTVEVFVSGPRCEAAIMVRSYDFRLADSGDLAARAWTEAVLMDDTTGQPLRIPPGSPVVPGPDELPDPTMSIAALPPLPAPPAGVFRMQRRVTWGDLDMTRYVADATLLGYIEACGFGVLGAHGWPAARMAAQGFAIIMRRHQIENVAPPAIDDELEIATWASHIKRATATRHYTITRGRNGALLTRVDTLGVWVDLATGRPMRIPSDFLADFAPNLVNGDA